MLLHRTALQLQEEQLLGQQAWPQKKGLGREPSKPARQHRGKFQPATPGWLFALCIVDLPGSSSPSASLRIQNPSTVSQQLSQHGPHLVPLLKPVQTIHITDDKTGAQEKQSPSTAGCPPRDRKAE